jgi:hypothetical protein
MQGPRITAVERMRSVVACRTVRNGTEGGRRDQNPIAILMFDRFQFETGGVGKESLDMARGRSHLLSTIKHLCYFMFWAILSDQTCTEIAGEPKLDDRSGPGRPDDRTQLSFGYSGLSAYDPKSGAVFDCSVSGGSRTADYAPISHSLPHSARIWSLPPRRSWSLATPVARHRLRGTDAGVASIRN